MSNQDKFVDANHVDEGPYTSSHNGEQAPSGSSSTLSWYVVRRWNESHVVYERHYDHHESGGPLTFDDFNFNAAGPRSGFRWVS